MADAAAVWSGIVRTARLGLRYFPNILRIMLQSLSAEWRSYDSNGHLVPRTGPRTPAASTDPHRPALASPAGEAGSLPPSPRRLWIRLPARGGAARLRCCRCWSRRGAGGAGVTGSGRGLGGATGSGGSEAAGPRALAERVTLPRTGASKPRASRAQARGASSFTELARE